MTRTWIRVLAAACVLGAAHVAAASPTRLLNPNDQPLLGDATPYEGFGASVAVDGTTIAIGSPQAFIDGTFAGLVRVFTRQDGVWKPQQRLVAPYSAAFNGFGAAIALEGDTLVVGATDDERGDGHRRGRVYVFARGAGTWSCVQVIEGPDVQGAKFGSAIALAGDELAVGAPALDVGGFAQAGSVTLFERGESGWHVRAALAEPSPAREAHFGSAVRLTGGELLIGAPGDDGATGAVYAFSLDKSHPRLHQRLAGAPSDSLGFSLASDGARLLAGAPDADGGNGNVVEWRLQNGDWIEVHRWLVAGQTTLHGFGSHVAQHDGRFIAGASRGPNRTSTTGFELYELSASTGSILRITPSDGSTWYPLAALAVQGNEVFAGLPYRYVAPWSDAGEVRVAGPGATQYSINAGVTASDERFGVSLAANARWLFVGAPGEHRLSAHSGAVFAYDRRSLSGTPDAVLTEPDGAEHDELGSSLALSGDTLLAGAKGDDARGSVRLYEYDGARWVPTARWPQPADGFWFGAVLAASRTAAIVTSMYETAAPGGAAYVYERSGPGWLPPVRLVSRLVEDGDVFGTSVAIDGSVAIVGRIKITGDEQTGPRPFDGAAHVFERTSLGTWTETVYMTRPPSSEPNGEFGASVAVDGDTIFVGAPLLDEVHVWRRGFRGNWQWVQRIASPADGPGRFGQRLRVVDHELWVAASPTPNPPGLGGLHRYRETGGEWRLVRSIHPRSNEEHMGFAHDFAVDGDSAFIGMPYLKGYAPFVFAAGAVAIEEEGIFDSGFED